MKDGKTMAVSSIFARIRIDNAEDAEAFVNAIEKSQEATEDEELIRKGRFVTDPDEIRASVTECIAKRRRSE